MILKNNRAPLLYHIKLCASFQIHRSIQAKVTVWKCPIRVKIGDFFVPCGLEIWWMILENNRAPLLYYIKLYASFQSHGWTQIGVSPETLNSGKNRQFFSPCYLEIWRMTLENNRAPLLYHVKLCASFQSHGWIQTRVTIRKPSIWVKIGTFFCPVWLWNLTNDLEKQYGPFSMLLQSFVHHFIAISGFKLELQSGNAQFGSISTIFLAVWPWNLTDYLEKQ